MENISFLKKVEAYLKGTLDAKESNEFESEIAGDPELGKIVEQYRQTLGALKRQWLSFEIKASAKSMYWIKLLKIAGFSIIGVISLSVLYFNSRTVKPSAQGETRIEQPMAPVQVADPSPVYDTVKTEISPAIISIKEQVKTQETGAINTTIAAKQNFNAPSLPLRELVNHYRSSLQTDTQHFSISNLKDTLLYGKSGTSIFIPRGSLVNYRTNKPVKENISISLCEFTDYYSMYKAKVSTLCDGRLLQSGGSCYLAAFENCDSVILRPGMMLTIGFDCKKTDTLMETFYGTKNADGTVIWQPSMGNAFDFTTQNIDQELVSIQGSPTGEVTYDTLYFESSVQTISALTGKVIYKHSYKIEYGNSKNKVSQSFFSAHQSHSQYILQPVIRKPYTSALTTFSAGQKTLNVIRSGKFGLINCDHFLSSKDLENVKLYSNDTIIESYMFFKTERSCYPSYYGSFSNIPANSNVLIVSIFAKNNKFFMSLLHTKTKSEIRIADIEPLDPERIKLELDEISKR